MAANSALLTNTSTITISEWRAIADLIADTLTAGGLTKTADTGQIDISSVSLPSVGNEAGYEIREFTDSLSGSKPVFLKIGYGRGTQTNSFAITSLRIGTGSDGSGNLTGELYVHGTGISLVVTANAAAIEWSVFADDAGFVMAGPTNNSANDAFISLERTTDANGDRTGRGLLFQYKSGGSSSPGSRAIFFDETDPPTETATPQNALFPNQQTTGLHSNGNVAVYPIYFFGIGEVLHPSRNVVLCFTGDFTANNNYTVVLAGNAQTMRRKYDLNHAASASVVYMMRYE